MKRVKQVGLVLVMALVLVGMVGCEKSSSETEKAMKDYATTYFNDYMIGMIETDNDDVQLSIARVSISMLKNANETEETQKFDLAKLSGCTDESYVDLTISEKDQNIEKYEFHLECK